MRTNAWVRIALLLACGVLGVCAPRAAGAAEFEFSDDFEGYALGTNPTNVYDFTVYSPWGSNNYSNNYYPATDLYRVVALANSNKVLQYYHGSQNVHFPVVLKTYKQAFETIHQVGISYHWTQPSMGWTILDVDYISEASFYRVLLDYRNTLYFMDPNWNMLATLPLWPDQNIQNVSHRVEVTRSANHLIIVVTRLDNGQSKSLNVYAPSQGGKVRFGFLEDVYGPVCFNADEFSVRGTIAEEDVDDDGWVTGEARFLLMNSPPLEGYRFVGTVRNKVWKKKKPGFLLFDCYIKE